MKKKALPSYRLSRLPFNNKSFDWYKKDICSYVQPQIDFTFILSSILSYLWYTLEKLEFTLQKSSLEPYEQMIDFLFIPKKQY